eukprot:2330242-Pyramimonas_sp.AAC.1
MCIRDSAHARHGSPTPSPYAFGPRANHQVRAAKRSPYRTAACPEMKSASPHSRAVVASSEQSLHTTGWPAVV